MTALMDYAELLAGRWVNGDKLAVTAHRIGFDVTGCAQLWERSAEGKRRDG